jgi:hypothetical protein
VYHPTYYQSGRAGELVEPFAIGVVGAVPVGGFGLERAMVPNQVSFWGPPGGHKTRSGSMSRHCGATPFATQFLDHILVLLLGRAPVSDPAFIILLLVC